MSPRVPYSALLTLPDHTMHLQESDCAKRLRELVDNERKAARPTKETPEEMAECEAVFSDF